MEAGTLPKTRRRVISDIEPSRLDAAAHQQIARLERDFARVIEDLKASATRPLVNPLADLKRVQATYDLNHEMTTDLRHLAVRLRSIAVLRAMASGATYDQIGEVLGVKRQRVHQLSVQAREVLEGDESPSSPASLPSGS